MKDNKKYYKDVENLFPIHSKKERKYLHLMKEQIEEYENDSYEELVEQFGTPIEVVKSYYDTIESSYLLKRMAIKRIVNLTCVFVLIIVAIYFGYRTYVLDKAYEDFRSGIPTDYEEVIEEVN